MHSLMNSVSDISAPLRALYYHWLNACEDGLPPKLSALNPHRLVSGTENIVLTEILRHPDGAPRDFRLLYIGRQLGTALTEPMTGICLSDITQKGQGSRIWEAYSAIAEDPRPRLVELPYEGPDPSYDKTFELFLPLRNDSGEQAYVLVGVELLSHGTVARHFRDAQSA